MPMPQKKKPGRPAAGPKVRPAMPAAPPAVRPAPLDVGAQGAKRRAYAANFPVTIGSTPLDVGDVILLTAAEAAVHGAVLSPSAEARAPAPAAAAPQPERDSPAGRTDEELLGIGLAEEEIAAIRGLSPDPDALSTGLSKFAAWAAGGRDDQNVLNRDPVED